MRSSIRIHPFWCSPSRQTSYSSSKYFWYCSLITLILICPSLAANPKRVFQWYHHCYHMVQLLSCKPEGQLARTFQQRCFLQTKHPDHLIKAVVDNQPMEMNFWHPCRLWRADPEQSIVIHNNTMRNPWTFAVWCKSAFSSIRMSIVGMPTKPKQIASSKQWEIRVWAH